MLDSGHTGSGEPVASGGDGSRDLLCGGNVGPSDPMDDDFVPGPVKEDLGLDSKVLSPSAELIHDGAQGCIWLDNQGQVALVGESGTVNREIP
jgi:hypothetical protein